MAQPRTGFRLAKRNSTRLSQPPTPLHMLYALHTTARHFPGKSIAIGKIRLCAKKKKWRGDLLALLTSLSDATDDIGESKLEMRFMLTSPQYANNLILRGRRAGT